MDERHVFIESRTPVDRPPRRVTGPTASTRGFKALRAMIGHLMPGASLAARPSTSLGWHEVGKDLSTESEMLKAANEALRSANEELLAINAELRERNRATADDLPGVLLAQLRAAEEKLHQAVAEADRANRAKTQFLANMSHEIRTPLNAVLGFSEVLALNLHGVLSPKQQEYVNDIRRSGEHLLSLINQVLDLSAVEVGAFRLDEHDVDLQALVADVVAMLRLNANQRRAQIVTATDGAPMKLRADEVRVKQILLNLVGNAIKFTPPDGLVTVSTSTTGEGGILLSIADNGIGIPRGDIARIMQPFQRADDPLTRRHEGSGLGLTIVDALVRAHGGRFEITSDSGQGTTATVRFPRERVISAE